MSDLCPPLIPSRIERIDGGCTRGTAHSLVAREPNGEKLSTSLVVSRSLSLVPSSLPDRHRQRSIVDNGRINSAEIIDSCHSMFRESHIFRELVHVARSASANDTKH